jgi:ribosomal protein S18 acetylase RimI-like enzyme
LLRLFDKTEFHLAQQLGDEEWLSAGAAFANVELASVADANHVRQAALPMGVSAEEAVGEVEKYFAARGTRCAYWVMNPAAEEERVRPLVEILIGRRWVGREREVMYLREGRMPEVQMAGMTIIPARASYRHARELAEQAAGDGEGWAERVEADIRRLDDPQCEGVLLLRDGQAIGRASVVTVGEIGRIEWVYVAQQWRRRGIGRALLSRALEMCARSLFKHVFAVVDPANTAGNRLLSQFGFQTIAAATTYQAGLL